MGGGKNYTDNTLNYGAHNGPPPSATVLLEQPLVRSE